MRFYHGKMEFEIPESVYEPREDSLLLAEALERLKLADKKVLEVGCGSGFLSILAAKKKAAVTSVDINPEAVRITKENAAKNGIKIEAAQSDLFSSVNKTFDIIIFNPPYLPVEEGETDAIYSGGKTGRETVERFVDQAENHLNPGGIILLLISSLTGEKEVIELFEKRNMKASAIMREKVPWEELIVLECQR